RGKGRTKKEAEKAAALQALKQIRPEMFEQSV
ncbi:MAG: ribonuclease III, partial [Clostridia bacterium]|nr:ribonuclease III [Clostridia bacterium]